MTGVSECVALSIALSEAAGEELPAAVQEPRGLEDGGTLGEETGEAV